MADNNSDDPSSNHNHHQNKKQSPCIEVQTNQGVIANNVHGDVIFNTQSNSKKDLTSILQKDLRLKYLENSYLQNIPGLDEVRSIDNHYVDLMLMQVFEKKHKAIILEQIFKGLKKKENNYLSGIHFEGEVGCGKTTLMWKIARDWANEEPYLSDFDLLFVIHLRDLEYSKTINSLIKEQWFSKFETDIWFEIKSKRILLLLDGFDELEEDNRDKILNYIKEYKEKPNFTIVITSRSGNSLFQLEEVCFHFQKVIIKGFANDGVKRFLKKILDKEMGPKTFKGIKHSMKKNQLISELRYNPLFLTLFCIIVQGDPLYALPNTSTELLKDFMKYLILRHIKKLGIPIESKKINLLSKDQNPPIVNNFIEELESFGEYTNKKLANNSLGIFLPSEEIEKNSLNFALEIGLVVQSYRLGNKKDIYEQIHLYILEFLRSLYLYNLFMVKKTLFFHQFELLFLNWFSDSGKPTIISFIFGLLGNRLVEVIKEIPSKLFFDLSSFLIKFVERENPTQLEELLCLLETCSNEVLAFDFNIASQSLKPNFKSFPKSKFRPLYGKVDVYHEIKRENPNIIQFKEFPYLSYEQVSINLYCINNETCQDCFLSEVSDSLKEVLERKPESIQIHSRCKFAANSMIKFLYENAFHFQSLKLNCSTLEFLNMKQLSDLILSSKMKQLAFVSGKLVDAQIDVGSISPLLKCLSKSTCELTQLAFLDVDLQLNVQNLLEAIRQSKLQSFILEYSSFKETVSICMSQLLRQKPSFWKNIYLANITVAARDVHKFNSDKLCLCNSKIDKEDLLHLLNMGDIQHLQVDSVIFTQIEKELFRFINVIFEMVWEMKEDWNSRQNKANLLSLLCVSLSQYGNFILSFEMNFHSKMYLQQIEFIAECIQTIVSSPAQKSGRFHLNLCILCSPDESNQRIVDREEISQLRKAIDKFSPFTYLINGINVNVKQENVGCDAIIKYHLQEQITKNKSFIDVNSFPMKWNHY